MNIVYLTRIFNEISAPTSFKNRSLLPDDFIASFSEDILGQFMSTDISLKSYFLHFADFSWSRSFV